ncbi:TorF family putative porin [Bradyrhizobium sp.]|uniref:TorF family putative porin n=1 Tax=Bradyrhizobium sp. TaxID=376 RepID=UPI002D54D76A|nr:TorF family putative porin [Bradyrhizobium sp.]HZR75479.1 TorF family putative porin [Bradyrhizobium sp.]
MKKRLLAAVLLAMSGPASAADLPAKATKTPAPFNPWDVAFGGAVMSDYVFRGITQSNHQPSVAAYFEPRYNINKDLQLYVGTSAESISFANHAAAEVDIYGGIRPTFGAFAFDFGIWGYLYPGGQCQESFPGGVAVCPPGSPLALGPDFTQIKQNLSFYEGYGKVNWTINDSFALGANEYYTPNFLNSGAWGNYSSITTKATAPSAWFGSTGIGAYVSAEVGRQWYGTTDAFYRIAAAPIGIPYPSYNTWNIGVAFTYKVFTLDLRYSDTSLSKGDCAALTSAFNANIPGNLTAINPNGFGSNWCGAVGIAKLSADLTAMSNLK